MSENLSNVSFVVSLSPLLYQYQAGIEPLRLHNASIRNLILSSCSPGSSLSYGSPIATEKFLSLMATIQLLNFAISSFQLLVKSFFIPPTAPSHELCTMLKIISASRIFRSVFCVLPEHGVPRRLDRY